MIAVTASLYLYALTNHVESSIFKVRFLIVGLPMALIHYECSAVKTSDHHDEGITPLG